MREWRVETDWEIKGLKEFKPNAFVFFPRSLHLVAESTRGKAGQGQVIFDIHDSPHLAAPGRQIKEKYYHSIYLVTTDNNCHLQIQYKQYQTFQDDSKAWFRLLNGNWQSCTRNCRDKDGPSIYTRRKVESHIWPTRATRLHESPWTDTRIFIQESFLDGTKKS